MKYKQITIKTLLNSILKKDTLFYGNYTIDSYQNCEFGCKYCDSSFEEIVYIKSNAPEILEKEIKKSKIGRIIIGSVHDPYQKVENDYKITRHLLDIIKDRGFSCHILTKSNLVLRDIDIISEISDCIVTLSIISLNESIYKIFESNVPDPKIRLKTIEKLREAGIKSGLAIIPILPYLIECELDSIVKSAKEYNADYILHKYLELKGDQNSCFLDLINKIDTKLPKKYTKLYSDSFMPKNDYINNLNRMIKMLCKKYKIKNGI